MKDEGDEGLNQAQSIWLAKALSCCAETSSWTDPWGARFQGGPRGAQAYKIRQFPALKSMSRTNPYSLLICGNWSPREVFKFLSYQTHYPPLMLLPNPKGLCLAKVIPGYGPSASQHCAAKHVSSAPTNPQCLLAQNIPPHAHAVSHLLPLSPSISIGLFHLWRPALHLPPGRLYQWTQLSLWCKSGPGWVASAPQEVLRTSFHIK